MKPFRLLATAATVFALALSPIVSSEALAQKKQLLEYPSIHSPVVGERGMVVSQNAIATKVGADILRQGGNAVDAAVATAFALAVTLPRAGNIGGDGFMMVHLAKTGETIFIDYRGVAPKAAKLETDATTLLASLPADQAAVGAAVKTLGADCGACHETYRLKD